MSNAAKGRQLTLELAEAAAKGALGRAREIGVRVTVSIVDCAGFPVFQMRETEELHTLEIATLKARLSWLFGSNTIAIASETTLPIPTGSHLNNAGGGFPLLSFELVLGGIGVSGATPEQDNDCANAGVLAFQAALLG